MIDKFRDKVASLKLSTGSTLIWGSSIGFLLAALLQAPISSMYISANLTSTMAGGQMVFAMSFATAWPWMLLFSIGVFLNGVESDHWVTKVAGVFILYWVLKFLVWEVVTVKPYVIALKPM